MRLYGVLFRREFNKAFESFSRIEQSRDQNIPFLEQFATSAQQSLPPNIDEALRLWNCIVALKPAHLRALYHIGLILYRDKKDFRNAKVFMRRVIDVTETKSSDSTKQIMTFIDWAILVIAEIYTLEGEFGNAEEVLLKVGLRS